MGIKAKPAYPRRVYFTTKGYSCCVVLNLLPLMAGYFVTKLATHPAGRVRKKWPRMKFGKLELFPCVRIHGKDRTFHLHHWLYMPIVLLISIPLENKFLDSSLTRAFLMGGSVQGFFINKKARRLIYKNPLEVSDEYR